MLLTQLRKPAALLLFGMLASGFVAACDDDAHEKPKKAVGEEKLKDEPEPEAPKEEGETSAPSKTPEEKKPATAAPEKTSPDAPAVKLDERRYSTDELKAIGGLSADDSSKAFAGCQDLLAQGVFKRYGTGTSGTIKHALIQRLCAAGDAELTDKVEGFSRGKDSSVDFSYLTLAGIKKPTEALSRADAADLARDWKATSCEGEANAQQQDFEHTVLSEDVDPEVLGAWRSCLTKGSNGFTCESSELGGEIAVRLSWRPSAKQAKLLPTVEVSQKAIENLEATGATSSILGAGNDVWMSYRRTDPRGPSTFVATAKDGLGQVEFSCSLTTNAVEKGDYRQDQSCGLKELKQGTGAACGAKTYKQGTGPVCGVAKYKTRQGPVCGVAEYNKGADISCPGSHHASQMIFKTTGGSDCQNAASPTACPSDHISEIQVEQKVCRFGTFPRIQITSQTRTCKRAEHLATCPLPKFGPKTYRSCEHKDFGPEKFKTCVHEAFGVATYKTCRHESFGKVFHTCFVRED